jgi:hypothetical protein
MHMIRSLFCLLCLLCLLSFLPSSHGEDQLLQRVQHNNPDLVVDLGVGLYAFPMPWDHDGDGDLDLVISCSDKPFNGVYLFENPGPATDEFPVFLPPKKLGPGKLYMTLSWVGGKPRVLVGHDELIGAGAGDWTKTKAIHPLKQVAPIQHLRQNQWRLADFDGDGVSDLIVGHESWDDFGWFDKNDWWTKYDAQGRWQGGSAHGWVYVLRNEGTDTEPKWAEPLQVQAGGRPLQTFGWPGPSLADFDGDGDLDIACGEFLDGLSYFENTGTRTAPIYAAGRQLRVADETPIQMDLQMINPVACDWNRDGHVDLIVGDEDGRVAFVKHSGRVAGGTPVFEAPRYFRQKAADVKFGALASPTGYDWDGDGDFDIISGNTAGYLGFIENLSGPGVERPKFAEPVRLEVSGERLVKEAGASLVDQPSTINHQPSAGPQPSTLNSHSPIIRFQAGPSGSIQGPLEAKWGYTTQSVADWDGDGLPDIIANSIWGKIVWFRNIGTRTAPKLAAGQPVGVQWPGRPAKSPYTWWEPVGNELVTQWRTTPVAVDWSGDGLVDLVMMDHDGYLALYRRQRNSKGVLELLPGERTLCDMNGNPLRLNPGQGGRSGRRKLCVVDWDGDGKLDLLVNSKNANWLRQTEQRDGQWRFEDRGSLAADNIEAHDVGPTTVDWDGNGVPDLLAGGEDGHFYYLPNQRK